MAVHEMLGKVVSIENHLFRIGYLRRECDLGVATDSGTSYLVRLSDLKMIRQLKKNEDFDTAILSSGKQ